MQSKPIGIFDSGVGGLTVFKEIRKAFPHQDIVYFGDTARVPYGSKSKDTVIEYSIQNSQFLLTHDVKLIVVACNTASAVALESLQNILKIPVIGVIISGAKKAVSITKNGRVGVIGTDGTIKSHAYANVIKSLNKDLEVFEKSCPLFVPLAEEGWHNNSITWQIVEYYLKDILQEGIDTLVLGCTHYPILKDAIQSVCGDGVTLVDSATAIIKEIKPYITGDIENYFGIDKFFVSDNEVKFKKIAKDLLGLNDMILQQIQN